MDALSTTMIGWHCVCFPLPCNRGRGSSGELGHMYFPQVAGATTVPQPTMTFRKSFTHPGSENTLLEREAQAQGCVLWPIEMPGLKPRGVPDRVACGAAHTIVLTDQGAVYIAGDGTDGQLGLDKLTSRRPAESALMKREILREEWLQRGEQQVTVAERKGFEEGAAQAALLAQAEPEAGGNSTPSKVGGSEEQVATPTGEVKEEEEAKGSPVSESPASLRSPAKDAPSPGTAMREPLPARPSASGVDQDAVRGGIDRIEAFHLASTLDYGPLEVNALAKKEVRSVACGGLHTCVLVATQWIGDVEATKCMRCATNFTLRTRRHHCRNCGGIFW